MNVEVKQLAKKYQNKIVLRDVNLTISSGQIVGVQGVSGSGKTTLLRLIAGLETPNAGQIFFNSEIVSELGWMIPPHQRQVGFVFQTPALWPHMRVSENISYGLHHLSNAEQMAVVETLAHQLELKPLLQEYPGKLSGGEAQRVALARTLAAPFKMLLLDEPFAHLDKALALKILPVILERCQQQHSTLIWVSHDTSTIKNIVNFWVNIVDGKAEVL